jgi:hypothetical protein
MPAPTSRAFSKSEPARGLPAGHELQLKKKIKYISNMPQMKMLGRSIEPSSTGTKNTPKHRGLLAMSAYDTDARLSTMRSRQQHGLFIQRQETCSPHW